MSNSAYGYIVTANKSLLLVDVKKVVSDSPLGLLVSSPEHLYNFPLSQLPQSDDVLVFKICDSKTSNTADVLLDTLNYVEDLACGLPREAKSRRRLLTDLLKKVFELNQVERLFVALTEVNEIEAVMTIALPDFIEATLNSYEGPPNILYILEKDYDR